MTLRSDCAIADPDGLFEMLVALHDGLDEASSAAASAGLILLLANEIGDPIVLREAVAAARRAGTESMQQEGSPG